jgi:hypothetical protein
LAHSTILLINKGSTMGEELTDGALDAEPREKKERPEEGAGPSRS